MFAFLAINANARSAGLYLSSEAPWCDPIRVRIGCYSGWTPDMTDGHRSICNDAGGNSVKMWWTGYPKASSNYSLRTGDLDVNADVKFYRPGQLMPIYLRVLHPRAKYNGLLLYATSPPLVTGGEEVKVGDWVLTQQQEDYVSLVPGHTCNRSIMHLDGNSKRYLEVFYFRAPPAGTGEIKFRCLLKTGSPNPTYTGDFLWTNNLTLTEGPATPAADWIIAPDGMNCFQACAQTQQLCKSTSYPFNNAKEFWTQSSTLFPCDHAIDSDCTSSPPFAQVANGRCTFHNRSCPSNSAGVQAEAQEVDCSETSDKKSSSTLKYFCVCGVWGFTPPTSAPTPPTLAPTSTRKPPKNAAYRQSSFFSLIAAAASSVLSFRGHSGLVVVFLFALVVHPVVAHNWPEGTRGRAPFANTLQPSFPKMDANEIHMQVGVGQDFVLEWASAHGDSTYFVIYHAQDENMTKYHSRRSLDAYLKGCPGNASANAVSPSGSKYTFTGENIDVTSTVGRDSTNPMSLSNSQLYLRIVPDTDPDSFWGSAGRPRPPIFPAGIRNGKIYQVQLQLSRIQSDAWCEYYNPSYPWIEAVHRYQHNNIGGIDAARARIPGRKGPGRYQIHYLWSSFRDTFDVDVRAHTVENPYGFVVTASNTQYSVGEHCMFEDARAFGSNCIEIVTTHQQCQHYCDTQNCRGFQVTPVVGPAPFPNSTQIPWESQAHKSYCNRSTWSRPVTDRTYACYTVSTFRDDNFGAVSPWTYFDDPDDVGFYSTCYIKQKARAFNYTVAPPTIHDPTKNRYRYSFSCLPCNEYGLSSTQEQAVDWHPSPCLPCENAAPNWRTLPMPSIPSWTLRGVGFFGNTTTGCRECAKWLSPMGSPVAFEDECRLLAARDPQCSSHVAFSASRAAVSGSLRSTNWNFAVGTRSCACWKKACCNEIPPVSNSSTVTSTFTMSTTGGANGFKTYVLSDSPA